jgi:hypothetical protein
MRGLLERNFEWSYAGIGGTAMSGDYWVIAVVIALAVLLLFFGWRGGNTLVHWGIFVWVCFLFGSSLAIVVSDPGTRVFADTLHTDFSYAWVIFPLDALLFAITVVWMFFFRKRNPGVSQPKWMRVNSVLLAVAVGLIAVEYAVFNAGEQHGFMDGIGILITLMQWVILNLAFIPWNTFGKKAHELR